MYKSIHDPVTGMVYPTTSNLGKQTVERYLSQLTGGSAWVKVPSSVRIDTEAARRGRERRQKEDVVKENVRNLHRRHEEQRATELAEHAKEQAKALKLKEEEVLSEHAAKKKEADAAEEVRRIRRAKRARRTAASDTEKNVLERVKKIPCRLKDFGLLLPDLLKLRCESNKNLHVAETDVKGFVNEFTKSLRVYATKSIKELTGDDTSNSGDKDPRAAAEVTPPAAATSTPALIADSGVTPPDAAEETGPSPLDTDAESELDTLNTYLDDIRNELKKLAKLKTPNDVLREDTYFNQNINEWTPPRKDQLGVMYLHHNFMSIWDPTSVSYPKRWLSDINGEWCKIRPIQEVVEKYLEALSLPDGDTPLGYYELLDTLYKNELKWWGLEKNDIEDNAGRRLVKKGVFDGWTSKLLLTKSAQTTFTKVTDGVKTALSNFLPVSSQKPLVQWKYMGDMHQPYSIENDFDESGGSVKLKHDSTTKSIYDEFTNYIPYTTKGIKRFHERLEVANHTKNLLLDTTDVWVSRMNNLGVRNASSLSSASVKGIPGKEAPPSGTPKLDKMKKCFKQSDFIVEAKFNNWKNIDPFIVGDIVNHPLLGNGIVVRTEKSKLFDIKVWDDLRKMRLAKAIYETQKIRIDTENATLPPPGFDETNTAKKYPHEKRKFSVVDNVRNIHNLSFYEWESKHKDQNLLQTVYEITNQQSINISGDVNVWVNKSSPPPATSVRKSGWGSTAVASVKEAATAVASVMSSPKKPEYKPPEFPVSTNESEWLGLRPAQFGAINVYQSTFPNDQSSPKRLPTRIRTFHRPPPNIFDVPTASLEGGYNPVGGDSIIVKFKTGLIALSTRDFDAWAKPDNIELAWRELCQRESLLSKVKLFHRHAIKKSPCENMKAWSTSVPKTLDIGIERPATIELGKSLLKFELPKVMDPEGKTAILNMATSLEQWCMSWTEAVSEMFWWIQNTINPTTVTAGCRNNFNGDSEGTRIFNGLLKTECDIGKIVLKCKDIIRYVRTLPFADVNQTDGMRKTYETIELKPLLEQGRDTSIPTYFPWDSGRDLKVYDLLILQSPRFKSHSECELFTKFYPQAGAPPIACPSCGSMIIPPPDALRFTCGLCGTYAHIGQIWKEDPPCR